MSKLNIRLVAEKVGGVVALSKALGLSRAAVSQWTRVPIEHVANIERLTGVSRDVLRPDVFSVNDDKRL